MKVTSDLEHHTREAIAELRAALEAPVPQRPEWLGLQAWTVARDRAALHGENVPAEVLLAIPTVATAADHEA
ncbi:MAG: hypothetical protein JWL83_923, partial [Actinomycetia bacterium]|nr:hypothetical protein [Actinomycetes bacterium]